MIHIENVCPLLQVFDMPASLAFYRDKLGFEIVDSAPKGKGDHVDWVWLRRAGANLMLNTAYDPDAVRPPAPDEARVAAHDDTVLFFGCPDVDGAYDYLQQHGVSCEPPKVAPYGMKQLYLKDPDGFTLCFQWNA
jgi:catechol 2,3-dioxygenase-like lactoylglutathione lyase family enzyme